MILVTLGLGYVLRELVLLLWNPVAYQMDRPPLFAQPGKAASLLAWFSGQQQSPWISWGSPSPPTACSSSSLGVIMLIGALHPDGYSRLGMIIRAGVQDREMVEALGINVRQVFTLVFVIGVGLAALGGIGAAPFIPVDSRTWAISSRCRPLSAW